MQLLDLFFPKWCAVCGRLGQYICTKCRVNLVKIEKEVCPYCEKESKGGLTHTWCVRKDGVDGLTSFFRYDRGMKKIIKAMKYKRNQHIMKDLCAALDVKNSSKYFFESQNDIIFHAVPLHKNRYNERGFNQSELILEMLQHFYKIPEKKNIITRIVDTPHQAHIHNRFERFQNTKKAFALDLNNLNNLSDQIIPKPPHKQMIIVDDVWTTGSTIKEIARILKKAGAEKVYAMTIAR